MSNSIQAVKDKFKNVSKEKGVDFNSLMRFYMYDRFAKISNIIYNLSR